MKISKTKIDLEDEKNIVVGSIVDDLFLRDLSILLKSKDLIKSPYYRQVITWCLDYYHNYNKAPKHDIITLFESKRASMDDEELSMIEKVLELSHRLYIENNNLFNRDYYLDNTINYLKKRHLESLVNNIKGHLLENEILQAENCLANFTVIEKENGIGIDFLKDKQILIDSFSDDDDYVFKVPGVIGRAIKEMYRGDVVGIGAGMKVGKTQFMMYLAFCALMSGLNVAFWTLEMKDKIMLKRFWQYVLAANKRSDDKIFQYAVFDGKEIRARKTEIQNEFDLSRILKKQKIMRKRLNGNLKLFDLSSAGGNVESLRVALENQEYNHNFIPDVIIVDYADILEPEKDSPKDYRQKLNHTWLSLKKLAQRKNCLVITASQLNRKSFQGKSGVEDIAEDIRKFAHVSHWINLNQTKDEKKCGILRMSVVGRHDEFNPLDEVVILQGLKIGRPVLEAQFKKKLNPNYDEMIVKLSKEFEKIGFEDKDEKYNKVN